jgi:hypothetical protein
MTKSGRSGESALILSPTGTGDVTDSGVVMREICQEAGSSESAPSALHVRRRSNRALVAVDMIRLMSSKVASRAAMRQCAS